MPACDSLFFVTLDILNIFTLPELYDKFKSLTGCFVRGCRYATSWCDLDLTFDLAVMTLSYKILSRLYLRKRKVES